MMNLLKRINQTIRGIAPRRAIASLLVAAECFSAASVGVPTAYAETYEGIELVDQIQDPNAEEQWVTEELEDTAVMEAAAPDEAGQVSPAEAAELGAQAAEQAEYDAELAAYDAKTAAYEAETAQDHETAAAAAQRAEEAANRAIDAANRAAEEAAWALEAYNLADQEARRAADEAAFAADEAANAAALAEELENAAEKPDGQSTVLKPDGKAESAAAPGRSLTTATPKPEKTPAKAEESAKPADALSGTEKKTESDKPDKNAELESAREEAQRFAVVAEEKAALSAEANAQAESAWAAANRATVASANADAAANRAIEAANRARTAAESMTPADPESEAAYTGTDESGENGQNGTHENTDAAGLTTLRYSDTAVTVTGEVPEGVTVKTSDVSEAFRNFDPESADAIVLSDLDVFAAADETAVPKEEARAILLAAYDISLTLNGAEYQPESGRPLEVSITVPEIPEGMELMLWHIRDDETAERIEHFTRTGSTVTFTAESFSVYALYGYTVDFRFGDYTYSIKGESEITLSALLEKLGVTEITAADAADVSFSSPEYIAIEQTDSDWLLRSLAPFHTEEALTLALHNGETVTIKVTDADYNVYDNSGAVIGSWTLDPEGVLTVTGSGAMKDYSESPWVGAAPWFDYIVKDETHTDPSVTKVVITDGITRVGTNSFTRAYNLNQIDASNCSSLTEIGASAFEQQSSSSASNNPANPKIISFSGCENLTTIETDAFRDCNGIEELDISGTKLKASYITTASTGFGSAKNSLEILRANACTTDFAALNLAGWDSLQTVELSGCTNLTELTVPSSLTTLDVSGCTGLTALDLSTNTSLTEIDVSNNSSLTALKLPASVTSLNASNCPNLVIYFDGTSANLPENLIPEGIPAICWGDYTYEIEREATVTLGEIFTALGISAIRAEDVQSISVPDSDPRLLEVGESELTVKYLKSFTEPQTLTITLKNGMSGTIRIACAALKESDVLNKFLDDATVYSVADEENTHAVSEPAIMTQEDDLHLTLSFSEIREGEDGERQMALLTPMRYTFPAGLTVSNVPETVEIALQDGVTVLAGVTRGQDAETGAELLTITGNYNENQEAAVSESTAVSFTLPVTVRVSEVPETYALSDKMTLSVVKSHNVKISGIESAYDAVNGTIQYTVTVEAESDLDTDEHEYPVEITDLTTGASPALRFVSGSFTYTHRDDFELPEEALPSTVGGEAVTADDTPFTGFPLTVAHMYEGDRITLTYTAEPLHGIYNKETQNAAVQNIVTILNNDENGIPNPSNSRADDTADTTTEGIPYTPLTREYVTLDGSWAYWKVVVNPDGYTLNDGTDLRLADTFDDDYPTKETKTDAGQSIDYASVKIESTRSVTYDYSGSTGTFAIPDNTPVTITYRTRIAAQPGEAKTFRGTARLWDADNNLIASAMAGVTEDAVVIYPSASDVAGSSTYMVKLYVYGEDNMQQGIKGARFILLDANQRALEYKVGENKGEPVTFITDADGYAYIELHEESGDVSIEKNTGYYLEMIQAVQGYQKDNTLYSFMITDDPSYNSEGFYKYFNGDTMKVRLYSPNPGLSVSIRFSGSYALREDQQNNVTAVLQKRDDQDNWVEVERHPYTDTKWGAIKFKEELYDAKLGEYQNDYRVIVENQRPWDLPADISLETTYYCMVGTDPSDPETEPQEFYVEDANDSVSVVIDNRYEEPQLTIVKMDKSTGTLLPGAVFTVFKIVDGVKAGDAIKTYVTDSDGELVIRGGEPFESETLYGIKETGAPENYLLPQNEEWHYFYFCNDEYLEPNILANLPEGATAVNLTNNGDRITVDNRKKEVNIPVMKLWQGGKWPDNAEVVIELYQSVEGGDGEEPVFNSDGARKTATLNREIPYNNTAFRNLPSRDAENHNIEYSIKEETINDINPLEAGYIQEYGVSSAGVYIVRNKPATTLTVSKEWYDLNGELATDTELLAAQSPVTFDVYRSSAQFVDSTPDDGITNADMTAFVGNLVKVRENLSFGAEEGWSMSIRDLDKQDDLGNRYYYYILETVPSFGNELYEVNDETGTVTIKNKIAPDIVSLTVTKAALKDDPRPESLDREFGFTLQLKADNTHPIRNWQVYTDTENPENNLVTDWNGEVTFTLKPTNPDPEMQPTQGASITFTLPKGVHASVTEAANPEYTVETNATVEGSKGDNGRTFTYETGSESTDVTLTYTNTLHVICKVVQDDREQVPFESLNSALNYIHQNQNKFTSPWTIYLLEDYTIPVTDVIDVRDGESLTITTAATSTDLLFHFQAGEEADRAVITRGGAGGSMFKNAGTLTLENIVLDGAKNSFVAAGDGGLVYSTGILNLNAGTTLRNSAASNRGGAVYVTGMKKSVEEEQIYVKGVVNVADGVEITGNTAPSASALWLHGTLNMPGGSITGNTGANDGAVVVESTDDEIKLSGSAVIFDSTNSERKPANLYIGVDSDRIINIVAPLTQDAHIGVTAMDGHMLIGEQFATAGYEMTDNLNRFVNDTYGYRGKLKDGTSTNVVWDGLTVTLRSVMDGPGACTDDLFTITLTSPSIVLSSYIIDGTIDYTVTPARQDRHGRIVLRNVKAGALIKISPLPVGTYTITESASNYAPSYTVKETESGGEAEPLANGSFYAENNCEITVTNKRRLADVTLTKTTDDRLKTADEPQSFNFTVKLAEADGTGVKGFALYTAPEKSIVTDENGEANFTMSPTNKEKDVLSFQAPVGATMTITETDDPSYKITASASAKTAPSEGEAAPIEDQDTANANVFALPVTDDGAAVTFANERKRTDITLSKTLVGKVSKTESYEFTVTLTRADGVSTAGYTMYEDAEDPKKNITVGEGGTVTIPFSFGEDESAKSVTLTIPEGTKLEVAETEIKKNVDGTEQLIYDTTYSINGGEAVSDATATIEKVSDSDRSIAFTNTRKTQTVTVTNTVNGYSGNVVPFAFTATVTDGEENDYDANGFTDGVQTFELATGQNKVLTVPYGAQLTVAESFIVGYETTMKHGNADAVLTTEDEFVVTENVETVFTNTQLIMMVIENKTSSPLSNVQVYIQTGTKMYRVNEEQDGQDPVHMLNKWAEISVSAGESAILAIEHGPIPSGTKKEEFSQAYIVKGNGPATGYYYTINNEPSFHEFADPAIMRIYDTEAFEVKGRLRYSVSDSTVTFTEQPLVSFDVNGGAWTTEMDGYRDRDGDRKVYQYAVNRGETAPRPAPDPIYPAAENVRFLGWTTDTDLAHRGSTAQDDVSGSLFDFDTPVTEPIELYAIWENRETVTYDFGAGDWTDPDPDFEEVSAHSRNRRVALDSTAARPSDPTAPEGYAFLGWTTDTDLGGINTFGSTEQLAGARAALYSFGDPVTQRLTLYAVYAKTWTVTFDLSTGTDLLTGYIWNETDASYYQQKPSYRYAATVIGGDTVRQPANPGWTGEEGYIFLMWTMDGSYRGRTASSTDVVPGFDFNTAVTEDTVLFTSWANAAALYVTVQKRVVGPEDADRKFSFRYSVTENDAEVYGSTFALRPGESRTLTALATDTSVQKLTVSETVDGDEYAAAVAQALTGSGEAFSGGTITGASYSIAALKDDGTAWDADGKGVTVTFTNTRRYHDVTLVNNVSSGAVAYTATLTNGDSAISAHTLFDSVTTDADGRTTFTLTGSVSQALRIPNGAKLTLRVTSADVYTETSSEQFTDADADARSFTIDAVDRDGTVTFTSCVCKITDGDDALLYDKNGKPAVYRKLSDAFTAYTGDFYKEAAKENPATPTFVKMLVDEYEIGSAHTFPDKTMTLTTAGRDDADFPYVGVRDRSTLYRTAAGANDYCFKLTDSSDITLSDIVLDGGSEKNVKISKDKFGGLVYGASASCVLNVATGTTLRNCVYSSYDTNKSLGGAIYMTNGTLNVTGGLFSRLHAYRGGAIYVMDGTVNVTAGDKGIRFEYCYTGAGSEGDGGAIYYSNKNALTINGGQDKDNPGIVFDSCVANGNKGSGGAIYVNTSNNNPASIYGCSFIECSARDETNIHAAYGGGAICADQVSGLTASYCSFTDCDTMSRGGAIVVYVKEGGEVSLDHSTFERCNCRGQGGAMAVYQPNQEGDRTDTRAKTKLSVDSCEFSNCSSGTQNGSGGAIQCYVPCMEFTNTTFSDCWAGKEGGAVNNYFGKGYTVMWDGSYLTLTNCRFIRCRAEDRYQAEQPQHYGGAVNTKVKTVTVTGSTFIECVSTLREGGALHLGGQGSGSKATITGSTFKNCTAKNGGGALLASAETLMIDGCYFYGCGSSASNGGAVYHYKNSRGDSTQKNITIKNSTFSADPNDSESVGCSAAQNGGAIWTRANTNVTLENLTIDGCIASVNGGGVYLDPTTTTAKLTGGSITGCQAVSGSAVYVGKSATFSGITVGGAETDGNVCSNINSGAIHGGTLYFEGSTRVENNTCIADSAYDHDVLLQNDNNTTIYTTSVGLGRDARIGVYTTTGKPYNNHGKEGQPFGTYDSSANGSENLEGFFNDRRDPGKEELVGYQASASDFLIYWGSYLCKITDAEGNTLKRSNGKPAIYQRLSAALDEFTSVTNDDGETGKAVYIKMLVENYPVKQDAAISNFPAADVTITTAGKNDADNKYRGADGTVCTIYRTDSKNNALFSLSNAAATLQFENITLDGRINRTGTQGSYRLVEASNGSLIVNDGTTMRYGRASGKDDIGGAIYAQANATLQINSKTGNPVRFEHCNSNWGGGAVGVRGSLDITSETAADGTRSATYFTDCTSQRGGAIGSRANGDFHIAVDGAVFQNCNSANEGGAIFNDNYNNNTASTTINNSVFTGCYAGPGTNGHGGAVFTRTAYLTVKGCRFVDCYAQMNAGAIDHHNDYQNEDTNNSRQKTIIEDTGFYGCSTRGNNNSSCYGGSVYTRAKLVEIKECEFHDSTAYNHGGALYCWSNINNSQVTVTDTVFENCSVTRDNGRGGAIDSRSKNLTLDRNTTVSGCTAKGFSGAVHMETDDKDDNKNLVLNIKDGVKISGCYANQGGAIYLKNTVTLNLTESPEFTQNGYTTQNNTIVDAEKGACIYLAEGGRINLQGSPKFSRNILPNEARITNGGITDYVRQDIYLAGYSEKEATSIYVTGKLEGDVIWVWPEQSPHKLANEQFAKVADTVTVSDETLSHFRNALSDEETHCEYGEYLAGVQLSQENKNVYWDKMYVIDFRKKDNKGVAVPEAGFTLFSDRACKPENAVAAAASADGENDTDTQGKLLARGTVEFASIRIGAYYMKETTVPASFKENNATYLVLVGTPYLSPNQDNKFLWEGEGPLNVPDAATLVARHTTNAGKYYGIFPLDENNKAVLRANLAGNNVGIENIRNDYQVSFMKVDGSGNPLPGAAFTIYDAVLDSEGQPVIYEGYPELMRWSRDGETYPAPAVSADGSPAYRDVNNRTLSKGLVYFRELPLGTYYLLETAYPERNGSGRRTYYEESDRVFKLEIEEDETAATGIKVTLSEWKLDGEGSAYYKDLPKSGEYFVVSNREVVCKLTDGSDNLLYVKGHKVRENKNSDASARLFPAVYATLEAGFAAAQNGSFVYANGEEANVDAVKLKVLKDSSISSPISYSGDRCITFTTAETRATNDRYVFSTTRTSDTSRALITRGYSENSDEGALITLATGTDLTLQNIRLNGQSTMSNGRAIHVTDKSSLNILDNTQLEYFKQEVSADSTGVHNVQGGAVLMDDGTSLSINGGYYRTAIFYNNVVSNNRLSGSPAVDGKEHTGADGGAIAVGANCTFSITNAQFTRNSAIAAAEKKGNGGAVSINKTKDADEQADLPILNVIFQNNTASYKGGAIRTAENCNLTVNNCTFASNTVSGSGSEGGAIAVLSKKDSPSTLAITGGTTFTNNEAESGGAVKIGGYGTLTLNNVTMRSNKASANGGAVSAAPGALVTFTGGTISGNKADSNGGAFYVESKSTTSTETTEDGEEVTVTVTDASSLTITGGSVTGNTAAGNGGAVYGADYAGIAVTGGSVTGNTAAGNGGAVYGADYAGIAVTGGSITGNTASLGSALYAADYAVATVTDAVITGNRARGENGGAINVGGRNAKLHFGGTPTVFDNFGAGDTVQQKNLILDVDYNDVINTTADGLLNGVIGVYVIESNNTSNTIFENHGLPGKPFATFGDADRLNPQVFRSDHSLALYGVRNETAAGDTLVYWVDMICKLTNASDNLLYQDIKLTINGRQETRKAQAIYARITAPDNEESELAQNGLNALRDGFEAAQGTLYTRNGNSYSTYNQSVKLKMLRDYELDKSIVHTGRGRAVIFTTAELEPALTQAMKANGDFFFYRGEKEEDGTFTYRKDKDGNPDGRAMITRAFTDSSMIEASGRDLRVADIVLDGAKDTYSAAADGGIIHVNSRGSLTVTSGAALQNSRTTGSGGAVYVAEGASATVSGGEIRGNSAANGGAVYVAAGASATLTNGTISGNTCTGDGAGFYLALNSTLSLSGNPDFGGTDREGNGDLKGTDGNFARRGAAFKTGDEEPTNGGKQYRKDGDAYLVRQDIYITGTATPHSAIRVVGNITSGNGTIWVWAENENHYYMLKQFAVVADTFTGTLTNATYNAFRNARPDTDTDCGGDYLTGQHGDRIGSTRCLYWTGGYDFSFLKVDSFGEPLPGATFTLYTAYTSARDNTPYQKSGADVTATSSDGENSTAFPDPEDSARAQAKGTVLFSKIAPKVYYMLETTTPEGYVANTDELTTIYRLTMQSNGSVTLERKLLSEAETAYREVYKEEIQAAAGNDPAEYQYRVMNVPEAERKVILRKVNGSHAAIPNAEFEISRYDGTKLVDTAPNDTSFTSGDTGVYFLGKLPFGIYYMEEKNPNQKWYYLLVDAAGVYMSETEHTGYSNKDAAVSAAAAQYAEIKAASQAATP